MVDIDIGTEFEIDMINEKEIKKDDFVILLPKNTEEPLPLGCGFCGVENLARKLKIIKEDGQIPEISRDIKKEIKKYSKFYLFTKDGFIDFDDKSKIK